VVVAGVAQGCLLIGDIGGYTRFLKGVELEHSSDILADLVGVVVEQLGTALEVVKLEGDAVFCAGAAVDGPGLLSAIESCSFAFKRRLRDIDRNTTCPCKACRAVPALTLKFVAHAGEYAVHDVRGRRELVGSEVVLVHRMLKNTVNRRTGLHDYALVTGAAVDALGLDPSLFTAHDARYADVGAVKAWVYDLEDRWRDEEQRPQAYVGPGDTRYEIEYDLPVPPAVAWDWLVTPSKRVQWLVDLTRLDEANPGGVRGVGTELHCVHGKQTIHQEIVDWKPLRYFTMRCRFPMRLGLVLVTTELAAVDGGTRVTDRTKPLGGVGQRAMLRLAMKLEIEGLQRREGENLRRLLSQPTQTPA
jgi:uncharacterized protein YndB with AHSA1/START domain